MAKIINKMFYVFIALSLFSIGLVILAKDSKTSTVSEKLTNSSPQNSLPEEDFVFLNSLLSALGGFSGGGLLLIFLIRRLVSSYDDSFSKWEGRCRHHNTVQDNKNDKIINMMDELKKITSDLRIEVINLQANSADKNTLIAANTKVAVLEKDMTQMRVDVTSIMSHLLNKPGVKL